LLSGSLDEVKKIFPRFFPLLLLFIKAKCSYFEVIKSMSKRCIKVSNKNEIDNNI
jgi:hypothetical protein